MRNGLRPRNPLKLKHALGGQLSAGGGGPPPPYVAEAVHFNGTAMLSRAALSAVDNEFYAVSFWGKGLPGAEFGTLHVLDPDGNYQNYLADTDASGASFYSDLYNGADATKHFSNGWLGVDVLTWVHVLIAINTNKIAGSKIAAGYFADVLTAPNVTGDSDAAFSMAWNGFKICVGDDGFGAAIVGDIADLRIMPGVDLLAGGSTVPEATRRLFIDAGGKPVDPAIATAALGAPGAVLFSGNASTFPVNQGTGGTFTLTGVLTNASTSPSD